MKALVACCTERPKCDLQCQVTQRWPQDQNPETKLVKCLVMAVAMMIIIELESDFTMVDDSNNDNGTTMTNLIGEENQIIFIAANTKHVFLGQC